MEKKLEQQLLSITQQFLQESKSYRAGRTLSLHSQLEKDLGVGSLEKAELFYRIENHFNVKLPESLLVSSRSLEDIKQELIKLSQKEKIDYKEIKKIDTRSIHVNLSKVETLVDVILAYEKSDRDRPYIYLQQEDGECTITYGELYDGAVKVANGLKALSVSYGDTVAIMLPTSVEFFFAFYGILFTAAIPVPIYPPIRLDQIEEYAHKEASILYNAGVKILISFREVKNLNKLLQPFVPSLKHIKSVKSLMKDDKSFDKPDIEANDIALLQYTSGSTGNPKGVTLTHANLITNIKAYGEAIGVKPDDIAVSWLPLYHDMGLIGSVMGCLYHGVPLILMSPLSFLSRPEKWFWTIHYRRATLSAAPNFAYELCAKKINDKDIEGLDISCWRLAFNGAEAIYPKTLDAFYKRFKKYGFSKKALLPVYGLAECSVALTIPPLGREPLVDRIDRSVFEKDQRAVSVTNFKASYYEFVSCGRPIRDHHVKIVDDHDNVLPERVIGNLQFCGPSAMQGYYRSTESTEQIYHNGWWETGDLAYMVGGEIFITGRKKDLIIKAGRNYYPQEIEDISADIVGVRRGCVAAFGVLDETTGSEKIIVVAEKATKIDLHEEEIAEKISQAISDKIGIVPDDVIIVPPYTIPKTSSGKLRRSSCKGMYLDASLSKPKSPTWIQVNKLFYQGSLKKAKKYLNTLSRLFYTFYASIIFLTMFLPVHIIISFLSQEKAAKLIQKICKTLMTFAFCRIQLVGKEILEKSKPKLFVSNHTSYVDAIVLLAVLPVNILFIGKKELLKVPILGKIYKKLGHISIDRFDITKNEEAFQKVSYEIEKGNPVLFFPEGTFTQTTGVRPFKSGPFKFGAEKKIAICPVALKNVRGIWRAGRLLFSPQKVTVTIMQPKIAKSQDWQEIIAIRDWARKEISDHCGEDPIDLIMAGLEKE